jgi:hypothetical protein
MTSTTQHPSLTVDELERLIKRVEPDAFLVPPRLLRRVIKHHREIGGIGLLVPHRKGYVIDREALLRCVRPAELGLAADAELAPHAFLIVRPDPYRLAEYTLKQALVKHWRILFHLRIDQSMQQKLENGSLTPTMVRQRIRRLGLTEFAEIRDVLRQEDYLLPPESTEAVYAEFVAVYLTLRCFDPARVTHFFPALRDLAAVDAVIAEDIDQVVIYNATRLPGLEDDRVTESQTDKVTENEQLSPITLPPCHPVTLSSEVTLSSALSDRLKTALELSDADAETWRQALLACASGSESAGGAWSQEARLLYDLQAVCVDREQGIYTVDLVEWVMSLGQLPIKRQLPDHQEVAIVRHLRRAMDRVRLVRLTDAERQRLLQLMARALEYCDRRTRERFRPLIASALDEVGLTAHDVPEQIGRAKMIEELLDRVVELGHFNIGNLRDAISRNQLKLPDLQGPVELVLGDPLIRLNRKLAVVLDGVYRRGEIYMRLLHRLSSVAFGTPLGRLLVLFLIVPFGLAFFVLITPEIAIEECEKLGQLVGLIEKTPVPGGLGAVEVMEPDEWGEWEIEEIAVDAPLAPHGHGSTHALPMPNLWAVVGLGIFFLLLFNVDDFRSRFFGGLSMLGRGLRTGFIGLICSPALQAILHNRFWGPFRRFVFWPGLMATTGGLLAWWLGLKTPAIAGVAAGCLALGIVLLNTRLGLDIEESVTDWLQRVWVWLSINFFPGLLHFFMDVSRRCLDAVEQMLYAVNEWLRFRSGASQVVVVLKAVLGLFWFGVTYVIRFAVNLLIEPQVNPIKHFPVVTVAHKVCLPMIPTLASILRTTAAIRRPTATATGIIFGIPGIFGFMVWELKENWKLYASNRAANLKPVLIGSHGETMLRLLRPGFHSGTIPKLYQRLRRAERYAQQRTIRKINASLHHVAESIAHFVDRELLALLRQSKAWGGLTVELERIGLATNRVVVELGCNALGEQPLVFAFNHQNGWLLASVLESGWLLRLKPTQRQALATALAGLYKMAGVHLTREQIDACLPPATFAFTITDDGLVVWTAAESGHDAVYDLSAGPELHPKPLNGALPAGMPVLDTTRLLLNSVPLAWHDWVLTWEGDHANSEGRQLAVAVLPAAKCP